MALMKKIMIIEDDDSISDAAKLLLERVGYSVTLFSNGDSIMNNEYELPDMFILDKQLPGVDGLELCEFLKTQHDTKHIPVIMLSASPQISRLATLSGADDALEKPFRMKDLRDMVAKYINYDDLHSSLKPDDMPK